MYIVQYKNADGEWDDLSEWGSVTAANAEIDELMDDNPYYLYRIVED